MTKKEMSEIFAVMLLAYPNAETFKGGIRKLDPVIKLWTLGTPEVDYWTGLQAMMLLVQECKFPPTIDEFREKAKAVKKNAQARCELEWTHLRNRMNMGISLRAAVDMLPESSVGRRAITAMGGPYNLIAESEDGFLYYDFNGFSAAYLSILQKDEEEEFQQRRNELESGARKRIEAGGKK